MKQTQCSRCFERSEELVRIIVMVGNSVLARPQTSHLCPDCKDMFDENINHFMDNL